MDVALRVVESVTMMHNGRIFKEGRPRRSSPIRKCRSFISGAAMAEAPPRRRRTRGPRPQRLLRPFARTAGRRVHASEAGVLAVVGRNGMGKTTLCKTIMGLVRATSGSIRFGGEELTRLNPAQIARLGIGYVPQGRRLWRSLTVDEHLRVIPRCAHRRLDDRAHLRHVPAPRRTQEQWRRPALRRRAADARDLARAARQSAPSGDGRADRGPRARHRHAGRGDAGAPRRGRRDGRTGDRAEHRRRHRDLRERRHHGQRPHQPRDRGAAARGRSRVAAAPARRRTSRS